ncbi:MAG: VWA domain-containing protein, partial [Thermoanaerobaculia bacterium]|nr:VWA domain-containing protein [Thermoanaerobaculia bacterium]
MLRKNTGTAPATVTKTLLLSLVMLAGSVAAQDPAHDEMVQVRLIELDAVVTDSNGNHVHGLEPEDFELYENGRRQEITNFSEYRDGSAVAVEEAETASSEAEVQQQPRTVVLMIEAMRVFGRERARLFDELRRTVERSVGEGDRGQVLTWGPLDGLRPLTEMTSSRETLLEALTVAERTLEAPATDASFDAQLQWFREMGAAPDPEGGSSQFDAESQVEASVRQLASHKLALMERKTAAIQRVIPAIADPKFRNILLYVSGDFPIIAGKEIFSALKGRTGAVDESEYNTVEMVEEVARTANTYGVIIYPIRPPLSRRPAQIRNRGELLSEEFEDPFGEGSGGDRTFGTRRRSPRLPDGGSDFESLRNDVKALSVLAGATGGTVTAGADQLENAAEQISGDLDSYYTLAYKVATDGSDRERSLELRTRNRNYDVRMRESIVDRSDETRAKHMLVARLFEQGAGGEIEFDVRVGSPQAVENNQVRVPIELGIPVEQLRFERDESERAAVFSVLFVAGENIGDVMRMQEATRKIVAKPGIEPAGLVGYQFDLMVPARPTRISIAVFDENSGHAGVRSITVDGRGAPEEITEQPITPNPAWRKAMATAADEEKPIVAYFRPDDCRACSRFEKQTLPHPAIQRRMERVLFVRFSPDADEIGRTWDSAEPGIGVFDRLGNLRVRFNGIPDLTTFGVILNDVMDIAPHLERVAFRAERGDPDAGALDAAVAYLMLGREAEARVAIDFAIEHGEPEIRQYAEIFRAHLLGRIGPWKHSLEVLDRIVANALNPHLAGEAWVAAAIIHRREGNEDQAREAILNARQLLEGKSRIADTSIFSLSELEADLEDSRTIRLLPPDRQVFTGRVRFGTTVASAEVANVVFELDGEVIGRDDSPPFDHSIKFGDVPEQHTVRVIAYDEDGVEIGSDALTVNKGGERFWVRLLKPGQGKVEGPTRVEVSVRTPAFQDVDRMTISWNDEAMAIMAAPPWERTVSIPSGEIGVLRAVAYLTNGEAAEDAVLLNAPGYVETADVPVMELPVTVRNGGRPATDIAEDQIVIRESGRDRSVVSIQDASESPLTVGVIIDTSGSMEKNLFDVQEAAISFV